ncbi:hypothetical protein BS50DRAFT_670727 [Corynespora cassiicola Philippines]|uniref:Zn(2)-C6 fungal-type domain-containing protein n=1 Tax=Corynespora cassiicola Philippines TaxID=1448308 RepID=A0A2T2PAB8_CORCC|nr:hypothetical protein BS50DRAFT_670727 [Corynespora cassiicola Philippines]
MASASILILVTEKAANVCVYCRARKQGCDRTLPSCSRCTSKLRQCDYTPVKDDSRLGNSTDISIPLFDKNGLSVPDLTANGRDMLLKTIASCMDQDPGAPIRLSELVYDILDLADVTIPDMIVQYIPTVHQWCPFVSGDLLHAFIHDSPRIVRRDGLPSPLIVLGIFLVTQPSSVQPGNTRVNKLYSTIKQVIAILHTADNIELEVIQAHLLLAVFEFGHGLLKQAHVSLASCVAMFNLFELRLHEHQLDSSELLSLKSCIVFLDRMIALSSSHRQLLLICPSDGALSKSVAEELGPSLPEPNSDPYSPRKVWIRAKVALATGRVIEYLNALRIDATIANHYEKVAQTISEIIRILIDKPTPHTWIHCDAIAMAFCAHLMLHQAQAQYDTSDFSSPSDPKAYMALQTSRRMAWDSVIVAVRKVGNAPDVYHLPLAGLCCVIRASVAAMQTKDYQNAQEPSREELEGISRILGWFAARWSIGVEYQKQSIALGYW